MVKGQDSGILIMISWQSRRTGLSMHTTTAGRVKVGLALDPHTYALLREMAASPRSVGCFLDDLIRSEAGRDLRTLTATGASSRTRRTITGATTGALALLGAVLGTAGAYAALTAWFRSDLHPLTHVPWMNLVLIVVALPVVATAAGWLLGGREPSAMARQPLE